MQSANEQGEGVETMGFEAALERLEGVVSQLESGKLALERLVEEYAKGIALLDHCKGQLTAAERVVEQLDARGKSA